MFATGSHDGGVRIWTRLDDEQDPSHIADFTLPRSRSYHRAWEGEGPRSASPEDDDRDGGDGDGDGETNSMRSTRGSVITGGGGGWGHRKGPPRPLSFSSSESSR